MVCKIFVYEDKEGYRLYLNGTDCLYNTPSKMLELYINWYNSDFAVSENLPSKTINDYKFLCSFCPIDFYEESLGGRQ